MMTFKNILDYDMSNADYHKHHGFSSSFLRKLVTGTPSKAQYERLNPIVESEAMKLGTLIHCLVLEPDEFSKRYLVLPKGVDRRGKNFDQYREEAELGSKEIITHNKYAELGYLINAMDTSPDYKIVRDMRSRGKPEASMIWQDTFKHKPVILKSRPDWIWEKEGVLYDLKTTADASPKKFGYSCQDRAYAMQAYMTMKGYEALTGRKPKGHVWIVIENKPPYDIARYDMFPNDLDINGLKVGDAYFAGESLFYRAMTIQAECKKNNHWPGYDTGVQALPLSNYYINEIGDLNYDS